jgi:hypothetical protein
LAIHHNANPIALLQATTFGTFAYENWAKEAEDHEPRKERNTRKTAVVLTFVSFVFFVVTRAHTILLRPSGFCLGTSPIDQLPMESILYGLTHLLADYCSNFRSCFPS